MIGELRQGRAVIKYQPFDTFYIFFNNDKNLKAANIFNLQSNSQAL